MGYGGVGQRNSFRQDGEEEGERYGGQEQVLRVIPSCALILADFMLRISK